MLCVYRFYVYELCLTFKNICPFLKQLLFLYTPCFMYHKIGLVLNHVNIPILIKDTRSALKSRPLNIRLH